MPAPTPSLWATDYWLYEHLYKPISTHLCVVNPNVITIVCFALVFPLMYGLYTGWPLWVVLTLSFVRQSLDCLDGTVARTCNTTSRLGAVLDVLEDTLTVGLMGTFIVWLLYGKIPLWVTVGIGATLLWTFMRFASYTIDAIEGREFEQSAIERFVHDNTVLIAMITVGGVWYLAQD